jgi:hypothetical protein
MSKQNITHIPHPYLWGPTERYTPFYSLFRDKLSLPRELVFGIYPAKPTFTHSYCSFTIIFPWILLETAQIWRELAPHYFPTDCFGRSSNLAGTGSTLFSDRLFWRQLRFGGNWLHIIFRQIVLEAAQIWRATLFSSGLFWKFWGNWFHIFSGGLFLRQLRFGGI